MTNRGPPSVHAITLTAIVLVTIGVATTIATVVIRRSITKSISRIDGTMATGFEILQCEVRNGLAFADPVTTTGGTRIRRVK